MTEKQMVLEADAEIVEAPEPQTALARPLSPETLEKVIVGGDLKGLTPEQRTEYYLHICARAGVDPASRPFEFITLNNRLVLYARRDCTDQLRVKHGVSVVDMEHSQGNGLYVVTVKVQNSKGRTDMATGAVSIGNAQGEALANAIMKAETKAKRRATLSICGLGLLDETEVATVPTNGGSAADVQARIKGFLEGNGKEPNGNGNGNGSASKQDFIAAMQDLAKRDLGGWTLSDKDCGDLYHAAAPLSGLTGGKEVAQWIRDNGTLGTVDDPDTGEVLRVKLTVNPKEET